MKTEQPYSETGAKRVKTERQLYEALEEARCLIASAAYSIPKGTFAAKLWLFDAEKWLAALNSNRRDKL